jgi:hypothetical protein
MYVGTDAEGEHTRDKLAAGAALKSALSDLRKDADKYVANKTFNRGAWEARVAAAKETASTLKGMGVVTNPEMDRALSVASSWVPGQSLGVIDAWAADTGRFVQSIAEQKGARPIKR